jgi:hypothetical protein
LKHVIWLYEEFMLGGRGLLYFKCFSNYKTFSVPQHLLKVHNSGQPHFVHYIQNPLYPGQLYLGFTTLNT